MGKLRVAICSFPVSNNLGRNANSIRRSMLKASASAATVVHFPETALTGYGGSGAKTRATDYRRAGDELLCGIKELAFDLNLWVILGACRNTGEGKLPANSTYVISNTGEVAAIYDKRKLPDAEREWYSTGASDTVVNIAGVPCGFLICYELRFPELFEAYRRHGVQLIFHSSHNVSRRPQPRLRVLTHAQLMTRAADNSMWISSSNSSARHSFSRSVMVEPDGSMKGLKIHESGQHIYDLSVASPVMGSESLRTPDDNLSRQTQ